MTSIRLLVDDPATELAQAVLRADWRGAGIEVRESSPVDAVLALAQTPVDESVWSAWSEAADATAVLLVGPTGPQATGHLPPPSIGAAGPVHEMRLRPRGLGIETDTLIVDRVHHWPVDSAPGETLITANVAYREHAVATWVPDKGLAILATGCEPATWGNPAFLRLVHRLLHRVTRRSAPAPIRVGLLGYGAIGHEHAQAISAVPGLDLVGVADPNGERVEAARVLTPGLQRFADGAAMAASADVDAVVVSTPPDSHGSWACRFLEAGKHVVLEKPMALTTAECDDALRLADAADRTLVVYQNRRYDPDFRAIRGALNTGRVGDVFHLEAFVGTYQHPCNYWHSDVEVSGGALFDWGSHVVDQILSLMPGDVRYVTAANHKRVWHDVTNADHTRMTLHFIDGREATFVYSDLAAALKPRWYLLGTRGGIVGDWRTERVVARSSIGTLAEDVLAPADSPPVLTLHDAEGGRTALRGDPPPAFAFHAELAEWLREGLPMSVTAEQSRRVVAMLEAAEQSARCDGRPVEPR